jgi:thiamine-phosphate pyrophosphorylase
MITDHPQVIDANINRVSEGLRVIEEYCRFIASDKETTEKIALLRKEVNSNEKERTANLQSRNTYKDMRAKEKPPTRKDLTQLLTANFKRAEEGLRVLEEYTGESVFNRLRYDIYQLEKQVVLSLQKKLINRGIYLVSDDIDVIANNLKKEVALVQLRDKNSSKTEILEKAIKLKKITAKSKIPLIINDFIDIAITIDADGFHSGQDDIDISYQRKLLGPHKIIGRTTHNIQQGLLAQKQGADYVSVGPIWDTPSKPNREGIGFEYLKEASEKLVIPYVAIGGINLGNIEEISKYHPAMIGLIRAYSDIEKMAKFII